MSDTNPTKLEKLWISQNGQCYWCHELTEHPSKLPSNGILDPFMPTLDHLHNKLTSERLWNDDVVMACYACNNERSYFDCKYNWKEHERRSKSNLKTERIIKWIKEQRKID